MEIELRFPSSSTLFFSEVCAFVVSAKGETSTTSFQDWAGGEQVTLAIVFTDVVGSTALGEEIRDEEMFLRNRHNPDCVWISINGSPLLDEKGLKAGGVVAFRDITERKRQEEKLRLLSNAVEQTADMVFITDRNGRIVE